MGSATPNRQLYLTPSSQTSTARGQGKSSPSSSQKYYTQCFTKHIPFYPAKYHWMLQTVLWHSPAPIPAPFHSLLPFLLLSEHCRLFSPFLGLFTKCSGDGEKVVYMWSNQEKISVRSKQGTCLGTFFRPVWITTNFTNTDQENLFLHWHLEQLYFVQP